jgi:hypothetical protein
MDPHYRRLMYLRYADDFVILVTGSHHEALLIKHRIADVLSKKCGLELNKEKTLITATKDGFKFLGAHCIRISPLKAGMNTGQQGNPTRYRMRMRIEIPVKDLINRLKNHKYVVMKSDGLPSATARKDLINFSHAEIVSFYNNRIQGLTSFYSFAANRTSLRKIIMFLQLSCALTLALKYKLRTKRAVFNKFGKTLKDPETEVQLKLPTDLKVLHKYSGVNIESPENNLKTS